MLVHWSCCFANLNLLFFCRYRWHRRLRCLSSVCFLSNTRSFSFVFWTERDVKTGIVICMLAALIKLVALVASTARDLSVIIAWSFQKIPNKSMSTASMVKTRAGVQRQPIDRLFALQSSKTFFSEWLVSAETGFWRLVFIFSFFAPLTLFMSYWKDGSLNSLILIQFTCFVKFYHSDIMPNPHCN